MAGQLVIIELNTLRGYIDFLVEGRRAGRLTVWCTGPTLGSPCSLILSGCLEAELIVDGERLGSGWVCLTPDEEDPTLITVTIDGREAAVVRLESS